LASGTFPALPEDFEPTRATLHSYARAVGSIPRAHGIVHPKWWHISLKVRPEGLVTDPIPLPVGETLALRMDLNRHEIAIRSSSGAETTIDMRSGATGTELGNQLIAVAGEHGLEGGYDRARFEDADRREYDTAAAEGFFAAFVGAHTAFERHRAGLGDQVSPIQLWPHGFDLAFEWYGTRTEPYGGKDLPAQLNLGFYPAGDPYFYSNPWPFDESLTSIPLPHGATWQTEGWKGTMLPYRFIREDAAETKLTEYARAVFDAAAPTLEAQ
jgi:hypothetical protein